MNKILGVTLAGRALRYNLLARSSQKGFSLQSLTQNLFFIREKLNYKYLKFYVRHYIF